MSAKFLVVVGLITIACYAARLVASYADAHAFPIAVFLVAPFI